MTMKFSQIITHWRAEDAEMIIQLLDELREALCAAYGPDIVEWHQQRLEQERLDREGQVSASTHPIHPEDF